MVETARPYFEKGEIEKYLEAQQIRLKALRVVAQKVAAKRREVVIIKTKMARMYRRSLFRTSPNTNGIGLVLSIGGTANSVGRMPGNETTPVHASGPRG